MTSATATQVKKTVKPTRRRLDAQMIPTIAAVVIFILMIIMGQALFGTYLRLGFVSSLFIDHAYLIILAVAMTLPVLTGGIDLSVGAIVAITAVVGVKLTNAGVAAPLAMVVMILIGVAFGLLTGTLIEEFNMQPFIATLSTMFLARGLASIISTDSLTFPQGKMVAIVGPSGGGKTTLCHLIPRFYEISSGSISVDGHDIRTVTRSSLRQKIGIVQQDVFLFADTVRENIRYGRPDATDEEIVEAAKRAEIYDDIMAMPHGFDTYVGERGTMLSGGQKQRVSIARIFLKNPPILILDEATSALDSVTEVKIQHAFDELARGRTTLVIAHRLSTIRSADRILVVENGRIAEQGSHEALLAQNGEYASLWRTQNGKA